jgi:hypothetical protein
VEETTIMHPQKKVKETQRGTLSSNLGQVRSFSRERCALPNQFRADKILIYKQINSSRNSLTKRQNMK